jgi:hypothetical protein
MIDLFGFKDARIKDLEERVVFLEESLERALRRKQRILFQIEEFKKFSPRLWFDYFSQESGKFSGSARAMIRFEKWVEQRSKS